MSDKLKPCPYCGSANVSILGEFPFAAYCKECLLMGPRHDSINDACDGWNELPRTTLQWTPEKPTEPGWYWYRSGGVTSILSVNQLFLEILKNRDSNIEFAGPIPEPQEPR